MRILNLVAGQKWTGTAAVVFDQTAALLAAGVEAQYGFVGDSPLAERLLPLGWARPLFLPLSSPLDYAREARRLGETVRRERFDIVHAHATHDHWAASRALSKTGIPLVRTLHHLRHARREPATHWLYGRAAGFSFANREIARAFGRDGPIHPPVIDTRRFSPAPSREAARAAAGLRGDLLLFGTVGKMAAGRGYPETIRAAASAAGVTLVHVGHGELMPELKALAAELGAGQRNLFLGYQEEILPDLYRAWDAFVFPASGSEQGQRAILEAMASGVPVVAVDAPGVRDLMSDGGEGLIAATPGDLEPAIACLAADPELRKAMGARGRARALAFTGERFAEKAIAFYEDALRGRASARADIG
jgi:glycosyltransferase involved in cell wall biosynthesis